MEKTTKEAKNKKDFPDMVKAKLRASRRRSVAEKDMLQQGPGGAMMDLARTVESKKVLLVIPPKLLDDFEKMCAEESYAVVEGIREAMRRMIWDKRPDGWESPQQKQDDLTALEAFYRNLQKKEVDTSTLLSNQRNTL